MVIKNNIWSYKNNMPNKIPQDISKLTDEEKNKFVEGWENSVPTKHTQGVEQKLENIRDLSKINIAVPEWAMDRLKEAADHYVDGFWLSSIALCGAICEFICIHFLEEYICSQGIDKIIEHNKMLRDQHNRLQLLKNLSIFSENDRALLDEIYNIRNKYIHLNKRDITREEIKKYSLTSINNLIEFLII